MMTQKTKAVSRMILLGENQATTIGIRYNAVQYNTILYAK